MNLSDFIDKLMKLEAKYKTSHGMNLRVEIPVVVVGDHSLSITVCSPELDISTGTEFEGDLEQFIGEYVRVQI